MSLNSEGPGQTDGLKDETTGSNGDFNFFHVQTTVSSACADGAVTQASWAHSSFACLGHFHTGSLAVKLVVLGGSGGRGVRDCVCVCVGGGLLYVHLHSVSSSTASLSLSLSLSHTRSQKPHLTFKWCELIQHTFELSSSISPSLPSFFSLNTAGQKVHFLKGLVRSVFVYTQYS